MGKLLEKIGNLCNCGKDSNIIVSCFKSIINCLKSTFYHLGKGVKWITDVLCCENNDCNCEKIGDCILYPIKKLSEANICGYIK